MITFEDVSTGLFAAWRLFLRDQRATGLFDDSLAGVLKSFFCAVVVLPGYILLLAAGPGIPSGEAGLARSIMVDSIAYVISWAAWPLIMAYLTPMLDREGEYFRYVVAYNWSGGPQMLVLIAMLLIGWSGFIPKDFLALLNLGALVVILLYHMFILRVVLRAAGLLSFALVVGEFMLGQMVLLIRHGMLQ